MCYTIEINLTREQLEKRFQASLDKHLPYRKQNRVSAFSLPECPVICSDSPSEIRLFRWGLVPFWSRDEQYANEIRLKTFNAKSETLQGKASFRNLIKSKRCLVPVDGFYEWQARGTEKQPFLINLTDRNIFSLAGLFDYWTNRETGEILRTFTIITTAANPLMEKIHNTKKRMPVILRQEDESAWIGQNSYSEKAISLLKPYDEHQMVATEVEKELFMKKKLPDQGNLFIGL
jgi:putative SOS response-associated peptidase YedK